MCDGKQDQDIDQVLLVVTRYISKRRNYQGVKMKDKKKDKKEPAKSGGDQFSFQLDSAAEDGEHEHLTHQDKATKDDSTSVLAAGPSDDTDAPWDLVNKNEQKKFVPLPMDAELYAKMTWLTNNLPKMSLQKLAVAGTTAHVDALIKEHYKR